MTALCCMVTQRNLTPRTQIDIQNQITQRDPSSADLSFPMYALLKVKVKNNNIVHANINNRF